MLQTTNCFITILNRISVLLLKPINLCEYARIQAFSYFKHVPNAYKLHKNTTWRLNDWRMGKAKLYR